MCESVEGEGAYEFTELSVLSEVTKVIWFFEGEGELLFYVKTHIISLCV